MYHRLSAAFQGSQSPKASALTNADIDDLWIMGSHFVSPSKTILAREKLRLRELGKVLIHRKAFLQLNKKLELAEKTIEVKDLTLMNS